MRTAIVTGANRGVGRGVVRQLVSLGYRTILASRNEEDGQRTAGEIRRELDAKPAGELVVHQLDVTDSASIRDLHGFVTEAYGAADVLVNNAAVLLDRRGRVLTTPLDLFRATMDTNVFGVLELCQAFLPAMVSRNYGRVVNVSSDAGQIENMVDDMTAYRLSKIALNGLTLMLADSVRGKNVLVNAAHPGWVRTEMGGPGATRPIEEAADGLVWLATLPDGGPHGGLFHDRRPMRW